MNTETPNITQDANATLVAEDEKQLIAVAEQNHLQPDTAQSLQQQFAPLFAQARSAISKSCDIVVTDKSQTLQMKLARVCRLELKAIRVTGEKARKAIKEESLRRSRAIDGFGAILEDLIVTEETRLQQQEDFVKIQEETRKAALKEEREKILVGIQVDPNLYQLADMSEETFQQLVEGTKLARAAEADRLRKAEAERIAREAADQAERERIRQENERLKKEAAERESARIEAEKKAAVERAMAEKELKRLADEKAESERAAIVERMRSEREMAEAAVAAEKKRADALAEQKRIADEAAAKERARVAEERRVAAAAAKAELDRRDALAAEERRKHEEAAAEIRRVAAKAAAEAAEKARKERLRLQALADVERQKTETARAAAESEAHKQRVAREQLEQDIRDAKEKEDARIAAEKEAARKAAAAPDKEKLVAYAHAILAIDIPEFTTDSAKALANTIKASRDKFSNWVIEKADIL